MWRATESRGDASRMGVIAHCHLRLPERVKVVLSEPPTRRSW
jgi:hypothetical protein